MRYIKCVKCKNYVPNVLTTTCCDCNGICNYEEKLPTNADRIRAMSDEELAKKIPCPYIKNEYDECKFGWHERTQTCEECALEWLRKTASN